jgi:hypothetical protein
MYSGVEFRTRDPDQLLRARPIRLRSQLTGVADDQIELRYLHLLQKVARGIDEKLNLELGVDGPQLVQCYYQASIGNIIGDSHAACSLHAFAFRQSGNAIQQGENPLCYREKHAPRRSDSDASTGPLQELPPD